MQNNYKTTIRIANNGILFVWQPVMDVEEATHTMQGLDGFLTATSLIFHATGQAPINYTMGVTDSSQERGDTRMEVPLTLTEITKKILVESLLKTMLDIQAKYKEETQPLTLVVVD